MKHVALATLILFAATGIMDGGDGIDGRFWSIEELRPIYDAQVERLHVAGYAELFGGAYQFSEITKHEVWWNGQHYSNPESPYRKLEEAAPVWVQNGHIPFLVVIPEGYAPLRWQATRVTVDGLRPDAPQLPISSVQDTATTPRHPYLILNVNPGTPTQRTSIRNAERDFADTRQRGLTFAEGIALLLHYPNTAKSRSGWDENGREHADFGRIVFLAARYNGACPVDPTAEEFVAFRVRRHAESGFTRGYYTTTMRRDMTPNLERYIFPSCDTETAPGRK